MPQNVKPLTRHPLSFGVIFIVTVVLKVVQQYELALNVTLAVQLNGILDIGFQTHQEDQSCSEICNALCDEASITLKSTAHQ